MEPLTECDESEELELELVQQPDKRLAAIARGLKASRDNPCSFAAYLDQRFIPTKFNREAIVAACTEPRLICVLPPSHGKSRIMIEVATWLLGRTRQKLTLASWSLEEGLDVSRDVRDRVAQNPRFRLVFPRVALPQKTQPVAKFITTSGGMLSTIEVGDQVPLSDVLLIDDPIKSPKEAQSAVNRERVWDWYINAAFTRLNVAGRIVLICSRAHGDDLAGRLIKQGGWKVLNWQAIVDDAALWPDRVPLDYLRKTESALGPKVWRCAYQGEPDDEQGGSTSMPRRESFKEFLELDAKVPGDQSKRETRGTFTRFTLDGREALVDIVEAFDFVLANSIKDAQIAVAGGAQWGKTTLQHAFMTYCTGQLFRNVMTFLPDEGLVSDVVQTKFRPTMVDQLPWFAGMIEMGKVTNESGKTVNRIGVYSVTDGIRKATGMFCGLNKVPTTHSADIALIDEVDDVDERNEKFVAGRLTTSDIRLIAKAGTQRVHGRGMNKAWKDGSQGIVMLTCSHCQRQQNPEDSFPGIVCLDDGSAEPARLTHAGDFRRGEEVVSTHLPSNKYFLGCVSCGTRLDRRAPAWKHKRADQILLHNWSFRISQLSIDAIDLGKIVNDWHKAVQSDDKMLMFRTDVLAIPKSTAQKLTPEILDRARRIEVFDVSPPPMSNRSVRYGGLDMGGRCWFFVREVESPIRKRVIWAESIPLHQVGVRVPQLCESLGVSCTFVDQMPETKESRTLALRLNGIDALSQFPRIPDTGQCHVSFGNGLTFSRDDHGDGKWVGMKCAVVRFDKKRPGQGIELKPDYFTGSNGSEICVPMVVCNRMETVDSAVREFLTPAEGEMENHIGLGLRSTPAILLPQSKLDIWREFDEHHISGSERERETSGELGDYVDGIANHLLFANSYARLAEVIGSRSKPVAFSYGRPNREHRTSGI